MHTNYEGMVKELNSARFSRSFGTTIERCVVSALYVFALQKYYCMLATQYQIVTIAGSTDRRMINRSIKLLKDDFVIIVYSLISIAYIICIGALTSGHMHRFARYA